VNIVHTDLRTIAPDIYWRHAWSLAEERYRPPSTLLPRGEADLRRELLFCLLGGHGISYELNASAAAILWDRGLFHGWTPRHPELEAELSARQFEPRRRDGTARRYRFPTRKAGILADAAAWLYATGPLLPLLRRCEEERDRRRLLCACPGIGPKSASWLLRNCGLAERLAILDIHVIRAMRESGRLKGYALPRDYEAIEEQFVAWCDELGAEPGGFDLLLWDWSRTRSA
jgi:N-glycosylase/DNA lyase